MTKEEYLNVRDLPEIPMGIWFEYYKEKGGNLPTKAEFEHAFTIMLWNDPFAFRNALNSFYTHYNTKFNLWQEKT